MQDRGEPRPPLTMRAGDPERLADLVFNAAPHPMGARAWLGPARASGAGL